MAPTTTKETAVAAASSASQHSTSAAGSVIAVELPDQEKLFIRIQNMSCTANLGVPLNLKKLACMCRNTEYNPRRFAAVVMRLREPRATALLFASGKMVVTGVSSSHNCVLATKKFAYICERAGFQPAPDLDFKVQNMVGTTDVGFPIRLEGLVYQQAKFASYEPELFPGLIYRMASPRVVFLIFVSGKVVLTGAKKESDLSLALGKIYPTLAAFRKNDTASTLAAAAAAESNKDGHQTAIL